MASYAQPATWRVLGLSVAASYAGLGLLSVCFPRQVSREIFGIPKSHGKTEAEDVTAHLLPLLGARDLSIAAALYTFWYTNRNWEMGALILSGMILCVADTAGLWWMDGPPRTYFLFTGGTAIWAWIGWGLVSSF